MFDQAVASLNSEMMALKAECDGLKEALHDAEVEQEERVETPTSATVVPPTSLSGIPDIPIPPLTVTDTEPAKAFHDDTSKWGDYKHTTPGCESNHGS